MDKGFAGFRFRLVFLAKPAVVTHSGKCELDHPTSRQHDEPGLLSSTGYLQQPAAECVGLVHQLAGISIVSPDQPQARQKILQFEQY